MVFYTPVKIILLILLVIGGYGQMVQSLAFIVESCGFEAHLGPGYFHLLPALKL